MAHDFSCYLSLHNLKEMFLREIKIDKNEEDLTQEER
jgi:hypothetical protein